MSDTLVKVENVSKKFCRSLKRSLWYGMQDIGAELLGRSHSQNGLAPLRTDEFWAIKELDFELKRGDCLGLIGRNGAGKSTLLKILAGLLKPDHGRITIHGRLGALIELGTGFNPILSGRENVYVNGSILGFSRKEIDRKFDEIVAFSEIEEFIDTPVKNYSSGMKVRLGFAVAVHMDPDVLILDEVLAVGDAGFRMKSYNKMREMMNSAAVIFVSHSMPNISRACNQVLLLERGQEMFAGVDVSTGIQKYLDMFEGESPRIEYNEKAQIERLTIYSRQRPTPINSQVPVFNYLDDLVFEMTLHLDPDVAEFHIMLQITDKDMKIVAQYLTEQFYQGFTNSAPNMMARIVCPEVALADGDYVLTVFVQGNAGHDRPFEILATYRTYWNFKMKGLRYMVYAPVHLKGEVEVMPMPAFSSLPN